LNQGIGEVDLLFDALESVTLQTAFTQTNRLSRQFENVAKLIKTKDTRGTDRDIFYVEQSGFDTHDNLESAFNALTTNMNQGLEEFQGEMVKQNIWDDVVIVMVSEFARTLTENSGSGSDHGKLLVNICYVMFISFSNKHTHLAVCVLTSMGWSLFYYRRICRREENSWILSRSP